MGYPWGVPGRIGGPSGRSGTGRGTLKEVRDGSEDLWGGPGGVGEPRGGLGGVIGRLGKFGMGRGLYGRSGTDRGTLGEVRDGSRDDRGGPERVEDSWLGPRRLG